VGQIKGYYLGGVKTEKTKTLCLTGRRIQQFEFLMSVVDFAPPVFLAKVRLRWPVCHIRYCSSTRNVSLILRGVSVLVS
jgi:hypothetical protein